MGFRFQKRKKIAPGITVGVSKSGLSARVGGRNAGVSVGKRGVRASASAPGTGLSYEKKIGGSVKRNRAAKRLPRRWWIIRLLLAVPTLGLSLVWPGRRA